ncbi:MAG: aminotransferase class IV, partial [Solirubrobacterales bacterium]
LERLGDADGQLRLVITRGGRRLVLAEELPPHDPTLTLATVTYAPSVVLTGVKSLSYGANMQATRIAKGGGADEALLVRPDGIVLEAPTSTIFWVTDGVLRTPALHVGILDSITRSAVVEALHVDAGHFPIADLLGASEAFLASTVREIQPVSAIDSTTFEPGPRAAEAQMALQKAVAAELGATAG